MADRSSPLDDFMLSLSDVPRPRVCLLPTPSGDSDRAIAAFFEAFAPRDCEPSCVRLFGIPERPAERLADEDVIYVSGGNTANALAIWRLHGVDLALRAAWERGAVLGGVSAGANCWFDCCVTDSFGVALDPLARRARNPSRQLLPALRRRGAPPAGVSVARRRRIPARLRRGRRHGPPLRGHRAERGGGHAHRRQRLPRRGASGDGAPHSHPLSQLRFLRSL